MDARKLGVPKCIKPSDISNGHSRLNLMHCAHIFNNCPGLVANEDEISKAGIIDDDNDTEASNEERSNFKFGYIYIYSK